MRNLPSEQIPNDGGYHLPRLIDEANERLRLIGKHGKRATLKRVTKAGSSLTAQFKIPGIGQVQRGLGLTLDRVNLIKAEEICTLITSQLMAGTYTDEWLSALKGESKPATEEKALTCGEMLEIYKKHYFKQREKNKASSQTWATDYRHTERMLKLHFDKPISLQIVKTIIDSTDNNTETRKRHLNGLANFLNYFDNKEFKQVIKRYKKENSPEPKKKYIPSDSEIAYVYQYGFKPKKNCNKRYLYRYPQWQFLYGLLAVYGLRIHEAWNIKNWDKPVVLKNKDWIAISDNTDDTDDKNGKFFYRQIEEDMIVPAILDPSNKKYLLCIGHDTKTGYRVAFPISPHGHSNNCQWIKEFNLIQPLNLPDIERPLIRRKKSGGYTCSNDAGYWFSRHKYGFTPHALRHAYNIRGHKLSINQKVLADSLGHTIVVNNSTYLKHEGHKSKLQGLKREIEIDNANRNEIKTLKFEIKQLKLENERLKAELAMYKALSEQTK